MYGIVDQIGGDIAVQSVLGQGTSFSLHLPCTAEEVSSGESWQESRTSPGSGNILLVEDEPSLRAVIADYLREKGYWVHEAADAQEALRIGQTSDLDLLLTDIVMSGTNGPKLAASLVAMHPRIRVIFMSGYADHAALQEVQRQPNTLFLQKPFRLTVLAAKIRDVLEKQPG